ncbi:MAG: HipA domain-containing protein [Phascolarctobacterium sp.]
MSITKYHLMNKNRILATVALSPAGYITDVLSIVTPEAFPVGVYTDKKDKLIDNLNQWWRSRIIPASRDGLSYVLHLYNIESAALLSQRSLGLSLSDQYWINPENSDLSWNNVNFFANEFSKELGEAFFQQGSSRPAVNPFTPDASSNGWLKKKWVRINGKTYLAKAGSAPLLQQPYNEAAADKILDALGVDHVHYDIIIENNRPLCLCENFVTPDTEFVPAHYVKDIVRKSNNDNAYTHFLKCTEKLNIPHVESYLQKMLCFDYLIENSDRHFGNFGFIRDVNTLKFLGPAPLFDNGTSLWCEGLTAEIGNNLPSMPFRETHTKQLQLVKNCSINIKALDECPEIVHSVLSQSPYLDKCRIELITLAVSNRVRGLKTYLATL